MMRDERYAYNLDLFTKPQHSYVQKPLAFKKILLFSSSLHCTQVKNYDMLNQIVNIFYFKDNAAGSLTGLNHFDFVNTHFYTIYINIFLNQKSKYDISISVANHFTINLCNAGTLVFNHLYFRGIFCLLMTLKWLKPVISFHT